MCFFFVMGKKKFTKMIQEYGDQQFQCKRCFRHVARCEQSWEWFTVCWLPLIPFSLGWEEDVKCPACGAVEPLSHRRDIIGAQHANRIDLEGQQLQTHGGGPPPPPQQQYPQPPAQGYYK